MTEKNPFTYEATATVKSARRVLEILEYFDVAQRPLSLTDVVQALGYPPSSTSSLLHSMVEMGYLSFDYKHRSFMPTVRVTLLGSWINAQYFRDGALHRAMEELLQRTSETIILAVQTGLIVRYIHVTEGTNPMHLYVRQGVTRPLAHSGIGRLFLTSYGPDELRRIVTRLNANRTEAEPHIDINELSADLDLIRRRGYAVSADRVTPGAGVVAMFLPQGQEERPLAIGVGGQSSVITARQAEYAAQMKAAINLHLMPLDDHPHPTSKQE